MAKLFRNFVEVKRLLLLLISSFFILNSSNARIVATIQNGFWSDMNIWSVNELPDYGDTIIIQHIVELDMEVNLNQNHMIVQENGILCSNFYGIFVDEYSQLYNYGLISVGWINVYGTVHNNGTVRTTNLYVSQKKGYEAEWLGIDAIIVNNLDDACPEVAVIPPEDPDTLIQVSKDFIKIDQDSMTICDGETPEFSYSKARYVWSTGAVNSDFKPTKSDLYTVDIISKLDGTRTSDTIYIKVLASENSMPNTFTPNYDGINDDFLSSDFELLELNLFNRWGKQILRSETPTINFDEVNDGLYYYTISHNSQCISLNPIKGWVTISR